MGTPAQYLQPGYPGGLLPGQVDTTTTTGPSTTTMLKGPTRSELELGEDYAKEVAARKAAAEEEQRLRAEIAAEARLQAEREAAKSAADIQVKNEMQARRDAAVQLHLSEQAQLREKMHAADEGKNKGYWEDKSTPARIFSAIMVGLAEGANTQGGQSAAGRIMDQKIAEDRALKLQKYESAKERVGESATTHAQRMALIDNNQIVSLQKLADQLDAASKKFPAKAMQLQLEATQARQKAADIETKGAVDVAARITAPEQNVTTEGGRASTTVGLRGTGPSVPPDLTVVDYDGTTRQGRSLKEAEELRNKKAILDSVPDIVNHLKELAKEKGRLPSPELQAQINQEITNLAEKKKDLTGALTPSDVERLKDTFSTSLFRSPKAVSAALDTFTGGMVGAYRADVKSKSIAPAMSAREAAAAVDWLWKNPNDPRAPSVRQTLSGAR